MFKKLTLLIFVVISLNIYSQVVIKDEIFLLDSSEMLENTDNPVTVASPFYGRIYFRKECMYNWISTVKGEVVVGGESEFFGNYNCNCEEQGSCGGCIGYWFHNFYNMPMGTTVTVSVQYCYNHQWVEVPLQFVNAGNDRYDLYGMNPVGGSQWESMGYVKFIPTTPPDCEFACEEENYLPEVNLNKVDTGYLGIDICDDEKMPLGKTTCYFGDPEYDFAAPACYNEQLQQWWFNLDNNHSFLINYVVEICENNIPPNRELIYDWRDFPIEYGCDNILNCLYAHLNYGAAGLGCNYLLQSVIELHEQAHVNDYSYFINKSKDSFYDNLKSDPLRNCYDFASIEDATVYWREKLELYFSEYKIVALNAFKDYKKSFGEEEVFEEAVHHQLFIQGFVLDQINLATSFYGCN